MIKKNIAELCYNKLRTKGFVCYIQTVTESVRVHKIYSSLIAMCNNKNILKNDKICYKWLLMNYHEWIINEIINELTKIDYFKLTQWLLS